MDRRGFLKLAGLASAATILAQHAILPARAQPHPDWADAIDRMGMVHELQVKMGLITEGTTEVNAPDYMRVTPEVRIEQGVAHLRGTFPTVTHGAYTVSRVGLYDRGTGELLVWQDLSDRICLQAGVTLQVNDVAIDLGGQAGPMMCKLLGVSL